MEPKNGGLVQMIFLFNWVIFNFQMEAMLNFQGVSWVSLVPNVVKFEGFPKGKMEPGKDAS